MSDLPPLPDGDVCATCDYFTEDGDRMSEAWTNAQMHAYAKEYARLCVLQERERLALLCERARPSGGRAWSPEQLACHEALSHVADHIRLGAP